MQQIYAVDALNYLFRAYYAIPNMTNSEGVSTNALYGFARSLFAIVKSFEPSHMVIVFDGVENKKSREALYKEYKAHREKMPEDLLPQVELAQRFCEVAGFPMIISEGVEADDVIGSIAAWGAERGIHTYIMSSDKDLCQMVGSHTSIININKENLLIDAKKVEEIHGVRPDQVTDLLGLIGDKSDNIPGLEGIGPKTAQTLLQEYGTLENVLDNADKVSGKKRQETIINGREIALLSKQLATIHRDAPFPKDEPFYRLKDPDVESVRAFYKQMHFTTLTRELEQGMQKMGAETKQTLPQTQTRYTLVDDEESAKALVAQLSKETQICFDTETTSLVPMEAKVVGIGFCVNEGEAWYVTRELALKHFKPLFENPKIAFCAHNAKYDMHVLRNEGIEIANVNFDTMIASYLIQPQNQRHSLDQLVLDHFDFVKTPISKLIGSGKKQICISQAPVNDVANYCCEDVDYTLRLKSLYTGELQAKGVQKLFDEIEMPLVPILIDMERTGIFADSDALQEMAKTLHKELAQLTKKIHTLAGQEFNINSPKQMGQVLFVDMGIKGSKKMASGYSTNASILEKLRDDHEIIDQILSYRQLEKLRSTYAESLPDQVNPKTGRIHCTFNQSVAATGRLSCQAPNLQNIPVRTEGGKMIRRAFRPEKNSRCFLSADYSQIELRLLAHLSGEESLIKAFNEGADIHAHTASVVFDVHQDLVTESMRHRAKAVNFGVLYGQQAFGLSRGLDMDYKEAAKFIKTYFDRYPKVSGYLEACKEEARSTGRVLTMTGRQRPIPDIHNKNPMVRAAAERLAINTPLQGTAADLIKMAMIRIYEKIQKKSHLGKMLLQIHDELIFEVEDSHIPELEKLVKTEMEGVMKLKVPLTVEVEVGKNWGEC